MTTEQEKSFSNASVEVINEAIASCGDLVRQLKADKAAKDKVQAEVKVLLTLKGFFKAKTGQDWKPGTAAPAVVAPAKAEVKVESYSGGGLTPEDEKNLQNAAAEALDAKIKSCGDLIRKLKTEKASKDAIQVEVKALLLLKDLYKKKTGQDWKPTEAAAAPAPPKSKEKKEEIKPENDGEKSEKQQKREAKKAEKQAKKAQHKTENPEVNDNQNAQLNEDSGEDVSQGKYGNAKMNQSQDKSDIRLIENFAILTEKLDNQNIWVRARLHTSRAKGNLKIPLNKQSLLVRCTF